MPKLVCMFSGWFDIDVDNVDLTDPLTDKTLTAAKWLEEKGNIDDLILTSFHQASGDSDNELFEELTLTVEND